MQEHKKAIFVDIDGTILEHPGGLIKTLFTTQKVLPGVHEKIEKWKYDGHCIVIVTARAESMRDFTIRQLEEVGIVYDKLIMGLPHGQRVMINDTKPELDETAKSIIVIRNKGLEDVEI